MVKLNLPPETRSLVAFVGGPMAVAQVISVFALPHIQGWYNRLKKPEWTPPKWVFGPTWAVMYAAQGYAGWRVLHQQGVRGLAAKLWGAQLALNFAWQPLFFNAHKLKVALGDILALDIAIALTALQFNKHDRKAAALLVPYLAWTTYATALNYKIMTDNPPQGSPEELRHAAEVNAADAVPDGKVEPGVSYAQKAKAV